MTSMKAKQEQRQREFREQMERERKAEDLVMVQDPSRWPHFGVLPMVKRNGKMSDPDFCGFVQVWDVVKPIVYVGNMVTLGEQRKEGKVVKLSELKQYKYLDFEALVEEWRVD